MPGVQQSMDLLCAQCSDVLYEDDYNSPICNSCTEEYSWTCESCFEQYLSADAPSVVRRNSPMVARWFNTAADSDSLLCQDCSCSCEECGTTYADFDNAVDCCSGGDVHSWDYRPDLKFFTSKDDWKTLRPEIGVLYMGIELEVEKMSPHAGDFLEAAGEKSYDPYFVYLKSDGSLSSTGVEIVTMPATLEAFKELWPQHAMDNVRGYGARSYHYHSCGFHIHVSRTAFTPSHMWKFARFQMRNASLCQRVGQRENSSYAEWYAINDSLQNLPEIVKGKDSNRSRYIAINFQRNDTVEMRYFKGNILEAAIMKNVEFIDSIYEYTKQLTAGDIISRNGLARHKYLRWLVETGASRYPYLLEFLLSTESTIEEAS